jgi:hypothetical protein
VSSPRLESVLGHLSWDKWPSGTDHPGKSIEVLEDCQRFCYKVRHTVTSIDVRPDQDALERSGGPDEIPSRDRRLKQLKFIIEDVWEKEKSLEIPKIVLQVSRRVHLVELTPKYMEELEAEKAAPKKGRR